LRARGRQDRRRAAATKGLAALGQDLVRGAQTAVDEINAAGGVNAAGSR
jgi:ABC-type branched-subunit amino acid transport system substrate-binding protein